MSDTVMQTAESDEVGSIMTAPLRGQLKVVEVHESRVPTTRNAAAMLISAEHGSTRGGRNGLLRSSDRVSDSPALVLAPAASAHMGVVDAHFGFVASAHMGVVDVYFGFAASARVGVVDISFRDKSGPLSWTRGSAIPGSASVRGGWQGAQMVAIARAHRNHVSRHGNKLAHSLLIALAAPRTDYERELIARTAVVSGAADNVAGHQHQGRVVVE